MCCRAKRDDIEAYWWEEEAYGDSKKRTTSPLSSSKTKLAVSSAVSSPGTKIAAAGPGEVRTGDAAEQQGPGGEETPPLSPQKYADMVDDRPVSWADFMLDNNKLDQDAEDIGVQVRGRTYEVDMRKRMMKPCYWPAAKHRVLRGTWFVGKQGDFVPVREMIAERLEQAFLSRAWDPSKGLLKTQNDGRLAARVELTMHQGSVGMFALFYSGYEVYLAWDTSFAWIKKRLSKSGGETRLPLRRGYKEPDSPAALQKEANCAQEKEDDEVAQCPVPSSLILAVHGIGQNLDGANIAQDVISMKKTIRMAEMASIKAEGGDEKTKRQRIEVLPVQWRKHLKLDVDSLAASLMPPGIPSLRHMLHSTAVEVLFYLTPLHRGAILDSVVKSLNSVYSKFIKRNPSFVGKVSIFAHSLGSVLCWDVLCNQQSKSPVTVTDKESAAPVWAPNAVTIGNLKFEVDKFFIVGSPLGCFLSLRGINQSIGVGLGTPRSAPLMTCNPAVPGSPDGLPKVNRLYNIFHPYDPVAYRLEPLAYSKRDLEGKRVALIELVGGGRRIHIAAQELGDNVSSAASRFGTSVVEVFKFGRKSKDEMEGKTEEDSFIQGMEVDKQGEAFSVSFAANVEESSRSRISRIVGGTITSQLGRPTTDQGRIDFALQEASLEHQYLAAIGAHFQYWCSQDIALFVYRAINDKDVLSGIALSEEE